jgi:hypothetical protein
LRAALLGIDCYNASKFLNHNLGRCLTDYLTPVHFTRSGPGVIYF